MSQPFLFTKVVAQQLLRGASEAGISPGGETPDVPVSGAQSIRRRMTRLGLRHEDLAARLNVSRAYVTRLLNSVRWPDRRLEQAEQWLAGIEAETFGTASPTS